jgi:lysophospholipase L1-like esterase
MYPRTHSIALALAALFLLPAAAAVAADPVLAGQDIAASDSRVAVMGRTLADSDGSLRFGFPGVSLFLTFEGKTLTVDGAGGARDENYLDVIVDHGTPRTVHLPRQMQAVTLADLPAGGRHTVEIVNRTETWRGIATLKRFHTDGGFAPAPALPARKLLVLGDSVTCAAAVDRTTGKPSDALAADPRRSYGMLLAQALEAQVQLVCMGGHGLVRSWDGKTELNLPEFYQRAIADQAYPAPWDQRRYQADLILSTIGTNDVNQGIPEREQYVTAYVQLVRTLLRDHPKAQIVLSEGAIHTAEKKAALASFIAETVRRVGDPRVHAIPSNAYPGTDGDAHPTAQGHAAITSDFLPQLKAILR